MGALDEIGAIDTKAMDIEELRTELSRHLKRVLLPLSLMDLENYEPLPRDWDILDAVATKVEDAEARHKVDILDEAGYLKLGNMHYVREEFEKALERYSRAAAMHGSPKALKNKGIALINLKRFSEAEAPLQKSLDGDAKDPETWFFMAIRWEYAGDGRYKDQDGMKKALECYDSALELKKDFDVAFYNKGVLLSLMGRKEEAMKLITEWLQKHPASDKGWVDRGLLLRNMGNIDGAIKCYDNAILINPECDLALVNKGTALYSKGLYEEALECLEKAIKIRPDTAIAWCNKGAVLGSLGKLEESIECYDKALEIDPSFKGAITNKNTALEQMRAMVSLDVQDQGRRKAQDTTREKAAAKTMATKKGEKGPKKGRK